MQFQLKSDYVLTGDQPQATDRLTESIAAGNKHQTLIGVTGSGKTFTLANVIQRLQIPTLVISHNKTLAGQLYQEFRDFFPNNAVSYFVSYYDYYQPEAYIPSSDTYIDKEVDINDEIDKLRLSATANLMTRPDVIVVASVSCIYNLGSPIEFDQFIFTIVEGQIISLQSLLTRLVDLQYSRSPYELKRGSFRVKGDTIQVWPSHIDQALRIEMLDNRIERIRYIDPVSGEDWQAPEDSTTTEFEAEKQSKRFRIYPAKHNITNPKSRETAFEEIKRDLGLRLQELKVQGKIVEAYRLGQRVKHDLEMIRELGYVNGIENYTRYFDGRKPGEAPYTLLDYFKLNAEKFQTKRNQGFLTIIDESHITLPQLRGMYAGDKARKQTLIEYGFRLPSALDNRPLQFSETLERLPQLAYVSATPEEWELQQSGQQVAEQLIRPTGLLDPPITIKPTKGQIADLIREVMATIAKGQRVLITTLTKRTAEALTEYLNDESKIAEAMGIKNQKTGSRKQDSEKDGVELNSTPQVQQKVGKLSLTQLTQRGQSSEIRDQNSFDMAQDKPTSNNYTLPKVAYLHSDIDTLDRSDILDNLRSGEVDVLVGINLLREGLDLPEVTLVAILEADKEGFLRSRTSLIQTMGRAARHKDGRVILYADKRSKAMQAAIEEVERRRQIQADYNQKHQITPLSISKPIREKLLVREEAEENQYSVIPKSLQDYRHLGWEHLKDVKRESLTPQDAKKLIRSLKKEMNQAAKEWDFEKAAFYRDTIKRLEQG